MSDKWYDQLESPNAAWLAGIILRVKSESEDKIAAQIFVSARELHKIVILKRKRMINS